MGVEVRYNSPVNSLKALLDSRSQWKVRQVSNERRALVNELTYSYRFLTQFARTEKTVSLINKRDLNVLGRRLYAAFERKADKVEGKPAGQQLEPPA